MAVHSALTRDIQVRLLGAQPKAYESFPFLPCPGQPITDGPMQTVTARRDGHYTAEWRSWYLVGFMPQRPPVRVRPPQPCRYGVNGNTSVFQTEVAGSTPAICSMIRRRMGE